MLAMVEVDEDVLRAALDALEHCAGHLSATDVARAELQMVSVQYALLTEVTVEAAQALRAALAEQVSMPTSEHVGRMPAEVLPMH